MMKISNLFCVFLAVCWIDLNALAQGGPPSNDAGPNPYEGGELYRLTMPSSGSIPEVEFGESWNPDTGEMTFLHSDVSIPGNSRLPVAVTRTRSRNNFARRSTLEFADWRLELPSVEYSWRKRAEGFWESTRCSNPQPSSYYQTSSNSWELPWTFFFGMTIRDIDGASHRIQQPNYWPSSDLGAAPLLTTPALWKISCITGSNTANQGFLATAPDGTTYTFSHERRRVEKSGLFESGTLNAEAMRVSIYPTRISDVHGNWVDYTYGPNGPTKIEANDGRLINLSYNSNGHISSVTANGRTWTYNYTTIQSSSNGFVQRALSEVTRPDGQKWLYSGLEGLEVGIGPDRDYLDCFLIDIGVSANSYQQPISGYSITHPNGSRMDISRKVIANGRTRGKPRTTNNYWYSNRCFQSVHTLDNVFGSAAVTTKSLTLSDGGNLTWQYVYEEDFGSYDSNSLPHTKKRTVIKPDGARVEYDIQRAATSFWEGSVEQKRDYSSTSSASPLRTETTNRDALLRYSAGNTPLPSYGAPYGVNISYEPPVTRASFVRGEIVLPIRSSVIVQDGVTYTTSHTYSVDNGTVGFAWAKPLTTVLSASNNGPSRTIDTTYDHKTSNWVLNLEASITRNGKLFDTLTYDSFGRITQHDKFGSLKENYSYFVSGNGAGRLQSVTDALGHQTQLSNYKRGEPQSITLPDNSTLSRVVNDDGWITSATDQNNATTNFSYNSMGWLTHVDRPDNTWADTNISYSWDPNGVVITETRGNRRVVTTHDGLNRPILVRYEDLSGAAPVRYTSTRYDAFNRVTFESRASSSSNPSAGIETDYDAIGRITESRQTMAPFATTQYNYLTGNRIEVIDPRNNITTTTYLSYGGPQKTPNSDDAQPILIVPAVGASTEFEYDIYGNPTHHRFMNGNTVLAETVTGYDSRLRLATITDPAGDVARTFYDVLDRPIVVKDGEARAARRVYDSMGRIEKIIRAWAGTDSGSGELNCDAMRNNYSPGSGYLQQCYQTNTYDAKGNLTAVADANGNTTTYTYNNIDLPVRTTFPDGSYTEIQSFDPLGNPTSVRTRSGEIHTSAYNAFDQMVAMRTPTRDTAFAYDAAGLRTCASVFDANTLNLGASVDCANTTTNRQHISSYAFDAAGRVISEQALLTGASTMTTSYQYDAMDNRTRITWPDNYYAQYSYDALSRLISVTENGGSTLAHYDYDAQSRLTAITFGGPNYGSGAARSQTTFAWQIDNDLDALTHRFTGSPDVSFNYGYDRSGRLTSEAASLPQWLYAPISNQSETYGTANSLNQYPTVNGLSVSYDLNGNRTAYDGLTTPHDSENRLLNIGATVSYYYDADGRRVQKTSNGVTTRFAHAGDMEIAEYAGSTLSQRYVPGHLVDQRVAWIDVASDTKRYYHADRLGSVQAVVNAATGAVSDQYVYTPYGVEDPLSTTGNPFRFTGRRLDPESGLYYYRARYYDPVHGRFLETDPIGYLDHMNLYSYVGNNPLNFVDPSGMCEQRREDGTCVLRKITITCIVGGDCGEFSDDDDFFPDPILVDWSRAASIVDESASSAAVTAACSTAREYAENRAGEGKTGFSSIQMGSGLTVLGGITATGGPAIDHASGDYGYLWLFTGNTGVAAEIGANYVGSSDTSLYDFINNPTVTISGGLGPVGAGVGSILPSNPDHPSDSPVGHFGQGSAAAPIPGLNAGFTIEESLSSTFDKCGSF